MAERSGPSVRLGALVVGLAYVALGAGALTADAGWADVDAALVVASALLVTGVAALVGLAMRLRAAPQLETGQENLPEH